MPIHKYIALLVLTSVVAIISKAQTQNINQCADTTSIHQKIFQCHVKSIREYSLSREGKKNKKLISEKEYNQQGNLMKLFERVQKNALDGNYTMTVYEYNSSGCRTKFENYLFNKDSVKNLSYLENTIYNPNGSVMEKNKTQYISANQVKHIRDKYAYNQVPYKIVVFENVEDAGSSAYTIGTYKYLNANNDSPDESEVTYYMDKTSYTKVTIVKNKFTETQIVKSGKTITHEKVTYTTNNNGFVSKEIKRNELSNKTIEETTHYSDHESTTTFYDSDGKKVNEETVRLPYGFPAPQLTTIEGVVYEAPVKSDTLQLKKGNIQITVSALDYSTGQYKLSQTLVYDKQLFLIKQDVVGESDVKVWEYENY